MGGFERRLIYWAIAGVVVLLIAGVWITIADKLAANEELSTQASMPGSQGANQQRGDTTVRITQPVTSYNQTLTLPDRSPKVGVKDSNVPQQDMVKKLSRTYSGSQNKLSEQNNEPAQGPTM